MALFENFPYTNLHELNLDWLINELNRVKESTVLSVNGQTGDVVLYQDATVQFPNIQENDWSIIRLANGTKVGIAFDNTGIGYIVHGNTLEQIYSANNQPPYPVTSVNGQTGDVVLYAENTVRLPDLDDISLHNWNIFRNLNNVFRGIQFNDDGTADIIDGLNRYQIYTDNDQPPYPVTSVNGQIGDVSLFTDNNGMVVFPAITDPGIVGWIIGRNLNGTPCYIQLNDDGTMSVTAGLNTYSVYTSMTTEQDIIQIPDDAVTDAWGLIRTTSEGSVGILFSNDDQLTTPEAYIRYVDSMDVIHTEKLLTAADIPSSSGVVSFNGMTGVVVVKGSDLIVSTSDTRTIAQALSDLSTTDYSIKSALAYVENTATATQNIPAGAYVIWQNNDYVSSQAISIGDTLSASNLTAINAGGITNDILSQIVGKVIPNQLNKITSGDWNDFTTSRMFYYTSSDAPNFINAPDDPLAGISGWTGFVLNTSNRIIQIAFTTTTIKYRIFSTSWTNWLAFKPLLYTEITGTTTANGNLNLSISHSDYAIVSALCTTSDTMCIPIRYNGTSWGVHVCSNLATMDAIGNTAVTVKVWYQSISVL